MSYFQHLCSCEIACFLIHVFVLLFGLQDLVFFTEDCVAIDTGHTSPYYAEDRLQLLQEER